ncbi:DUF2778 domain-containing protein [Duganella sp. sic0402]|uniref:tlde1 domain-containing protein n=1 Tax=Duganella sp. sic0402 TaxID=2854786 RepID=UPI001C4638CA|nr:tlde1 domain-containing protein [Duganella sp. sic0402]MBV7534320.1 DUF2778 domain-containing protein [Duganella sp. sic0402]
MIAIETVSYGVLPVDVNQGGVVHLNGTGDPEWPETKEWDYEFDFGTDNTLWSDSSDYFGDYGNYDNANDVFDGYDGVDSGHVTDATATHTDTTPSTPDKYWVYSQSSGNFMKVENGITTMVSTGYSGDKTFHNIPEAQSYKNQGPIPQGEYTLTQVDNHKGPNTISLSPSDGNTMFDRDNFLIHGDNRAGNYTASEGCIILDPTARKAIIAAGIDTLYVTR